MKIGFIGTGDITKAIVIGLDRSDYPYDEIIVSRRNAQNSALLAGTCARIRVEDDNQRIINETDMVFLAVRPQVADEVLSGLTFRPGQIVVTLIAMLTPEHLSERFGPEVTVIKATPLPFIAKGLGATLFRPDHPEVARLFSALGEAIPVDDAEQFDALTASTTFMGTFFGVQVALVGWLEDRGVGREKARSYLARVLLGLAATGVDHLDEGLEQLRRDHSTAGGLNEQMFRDFEESGGVRAFIDAIDGVHERIRRGTPSE